MDSLYGWIIEHNNILSLSLDVLSLIVTISFTIGIYKLESRREKKLQQLEIKEVAKIFLIDYDEEIDYLPLAEIASKLQKKRKHRRKLITHYLRCSKLQQQEILRQANIPDIQISWEEVQNALEKLKNDLEEHHFGMNIFYDGAKYLHNALNVEEDIPDKNFDPYLFEVPVSNEWYNKQTEFTKIISDRKHALSFYMRCFLHPEDYEIRKEDIIPPIDMVSQQCNLASCDEKIMTFWTMRIIIDACHTLKGTPNNHIFDEHLIETQEDMYYYTLAVLCEAYATHRDEK